MTTMLAILLWFSIGTACTLYWPIRYRHNMERRDWITVLTWLPVTSAFGPFAIILAMPL